MPNWLRALWGFTKQAKLHPATFSALIIAFAAVAIFGPLQWQLAETVEIENRVALAKADLPINDISRYPMTLEKYRTRWRLKMSRPTMAAGWTVDKKSIRVIVKMDGTTQRVPATLSESATSWEVRYAYAVRRDGGSSEVGWHQIEGRIVKDGQPSVPFAIRGSASLRYPAP